MMPLVPNAPSLEGLFDLGAKASPDAPADGVAFSSLLSQLAAPAEGAANPLAAVTGEPGTTEPAPDANGQALAAGLALAATLPMRKEVATPETKADDAPSGDTDDDAPSADTDQGQTQPDLTLAAPIVAPLGQAGTPTPQIAADATVTPNGKAAQAAFAAPIATANTDPAPKAAADIRAMIAAIETKLAPQGGAAPVATAAGALKPMLEGADGKKPRVAAAIEGASKDVATKADADLLALITPTAPKGHDAPLALATAPVGSVDGSISGSNAVAGPDGGKAVEHQLDLAHESEWLDRLAKDIARSATSEGTLRFKLHPANLGKLQVELSQGDLGASVRMVTETESARAIIADAQPRLIAEARAQGVRIAESHVDLSSNGGGSSANNGQTAAQGQTGQRGTPQESHIRKINQDRAEVGNTATASRLASERYA